ncbi:MULTISPECIES: NAD(P)H-binding protein [unclassified Streptomyces]|uniref:NAD(P)H-binding protein n=1 Tax=unclassified Streptomyces TaxID=2593676 RepID=UPI00081B2B10|nr:NAD(P)H-binding protein [Streptomyces sp. DvalAA-43]SCD32109.1 Putative NADH-flavin reductase [Streptomyces sp. DvalAA-43]
MRPDRAVPSPGTRPLDELDQVPWAELRHAYGPATDVPEQLRALVRGDRERRTQAWDRMWSNLYHQGSVYEATLHAVPFLLHMLAEETTPHPARVLVFLRHLVVGEDEAELLPDGYDEAGFADWPQQDRELEAATHAAVAAGVLAIVPLLDHQDPGIAAEAAHLLAWFPGSAADILPALRRLSVRSPLPRSDRTTVLIAIGLLAGACGDRSDTAFLERMLADVDDPDRWAAAVALSRIATPDVPAAAINVLVAELGAISVDPEEYGMEPRTGFCFNSPERLIVPTLHRLPAASRDAALDAVGRAIAGIENQDRVPWAEAADLVVLALGDAEPGSPDTLTPWQHAMLRALLTGDRIWASGQLGMRLSSDYEAGVRLLVGDVTVTDAVADLANGHDAAIMAAYDPGAQADVFFKTAAQALLDGLPKAGVGRLAVVGLAAVLETADGTPLMDSPGFPPEYRPFCLAHAAGAGVLRTSTTALDWLIVSPSGDFDPDGTRSGRYSTASADAASRISHHDFAIALLDEIDEPRHHRTHVGVETA